ncbi:hypothetical protein [Coleofasciculus sp. FACHB-1120]|nr:hypothetical protein [Coleofasciculus sp. FACHB-1120]MBD2742572.1 hypothetical protein [Coleofasciculus sp. FACHB-1120]
MFGTRRAQPKWIRPKGLATIVSLAGEELGERLTIMRIALSEAIAA